MEKRSTPPPPRRRFEACRAYYIYAEAGSGVVYINHHTILRLWYQVSAKYVFLSLLVKRASSAIGWIL